MTSLTQDRPTFRKGDHSLIELLEVPMKAAKKVYEGCMVALTSGGYLVDAGDGAAATVIGVADLGVDNTSGADGALTARVRRGAFRFDNSQANPVLVGSTYLTTAKAEDNHTICVAAGTGVATKSRLLGLDPDGSVLIEFI